VNADIRRAIAGHVVKFVGPGVSARQIRLIASDATPDRVGDIVEPRGIKLDNFRRNPVILFQHDAGQPIARCPSIGMQGEQLVALVEFPPEGTSSRSDEVLRLVKAGVLNACSIGFIPKKWAPISGAGLRFTESELLEISIVSTPANPAALVTERQLSRSPTRAERMANAARLAAAGRLLDSGLFSVKESDYYAAKNMPRGNCARPASAACGLKDSHECRTHRGIQ